jgi:arylsulfatase A-like enzyme
MVAIPVSACSQEAASTARDVPPDVVVLLADDLGWGDVSWNAPHDVATPNLARLAREGLVFERYYTAPLCTPARAGLLTGRSPLRMGLVRNLGDSDAVGLPESEGLLPESFRRAGYATVLAGKWHLGDSPKEQPTARGFDHAYGCLGGWIDYATHERDGELDWQRDGTRVRERGWSTALIAREAVRALEQRDASKPLMLHVAFNAPHPPLAPPPGVRVDGLDAESARRATLALVVADLDSAIGAVVAAIERSPRARETLVFFASDNGADPRFGGSNGELSGGKATLFEGGIRVPALLWAPGRVEPGSTRRLVTHLDVLPTLASAAGVELDVPQPLDGRALWPELATGADARPVFAIERGGERRYAVLAGDLKLIETLDESGTASFALFDLVRDPGEARDISAERSADVTALRTELEGWLALPRVAPRSRKR